MLTAHCVPQDGGFALSALLHHFAPDALDYDALQPQQQQRNLERVFTKANVLFSVPLLLDAADFAAPSVDEFSILLYLAVFVDCVRRKQQQQHETH